jgi:pilus assembly protein Flp/PilA
MNNMLLKMYLKFQELKDREEGQDLVEYALIVALVAIAAVSALTVLASNITGVFSTIDTSL